MSNYYSRERYDKVQKKLSDRSEIALRFALICERDRYYIFPPSIVKGLVYEELSRKREGEPGILSLLTVKGQGMLAPEGSIWAAEKVAQGFPPIPPKHLTPAEKFESIGAEVLMRAARISLLVGASAVEPNHIVLALLAYPISPLGSKPYYCNLPEGSLAFDKWNVINKFIAILRPMLKYLAGKSESDIATEISELTEIIVEDPDTIFTIAKLVEDFDQLRAGGLPRKSRPDPIALTEKHLRASSVRFAAAGKTEDAEHCLEFLQYDRYQ